MTINVRAYIYAEDTDALRSYFRGTFRFPRHTPDAYEHAAVCCLREATQYYIKEERICAYTKWES